MAVIFLFLDGVGIGNPSPENPFFTHKYDSFEYLSGGSFDVTASPIYKKNHVYKAIDANLDVEGLPQSGTGQTTLFSGVNAAKVIGKHFGPYPHSGIKYLLKEQSLFSTLKKSGKKPYFMNAYPPLFFKHAKKRNRWSCTTLMVKSAEIKLNSTQEILYETALTAEIVQNAWRDQLGINIPKITPKEAAQRLLNVLPDYDLVLYEYYLTDKAGHSQKPEDAERVLKTLDEFLLHIIKEKAPEDILLITSDHGNLEDLSTKTHTRNKVPLFVLGDGAEKFSGIESIADVKGEICSFLE
ncbi:MAG: hypothetical protein WD016_10325 [Balneolaceae bacterium]